MLISSISIAAHLVFLSHLVLLSSSLLALFVSYLEIAHRTCHAASLSPFPTTSSCTVSPTTLKNLSNKPTYKNTWHICVRIFSRKKKLAIASPKNTYSFQEICMIVSQAINHVFGIYMGKVNLTC